MYFECFRSTGAVFFILVLKMMIMVHEIQNAQARILEVLMNVNNTAEKDSMFICSSFTMLSMIVENIGEIWGESDDPYLL